MGRFSLPASLPQDVTAIAARLASSSVASRAEEGGKKAAGGSEKEKWTPLSPPAPAPPERPRGSLPTPPSHVRAACHRADVAATLYQLLSNGLLMHHEMGTVYAMLASLLAEPPPSGGFDADRGGTWLAGALLRLEGQEAAVLGSVMDALFYTRHVHLPALRAAFEFEVSFPRQVGVERGLIICPGRGSSRAISP